MRKREVQRGVWAVRSVPETKKGCEKLGLWEGGVRGNSKKVRGQCLRSVAIIGGRVEKLEKIRELKKKLIRITAICKTPENLSTFEGQRARSTERGGKGSRKKEINSLLVNRSEIKNNNVGGKI